MKYARTQIPSAAFKVQDYTSLMKSGGSLRGRGFLLPSDCPPAAIASLVLIHLNRDSSLA